MYGQALAGSHCIRRKQVIRLSAGAGKRDVKKGNNSANRMERFRRVERRYAARRTEVTMSRVNR